MATSSTVILALSLLILAATTGCSEEVETVGSTANGNEDCSQPRIQQAVRRFMRNRNLFRLKRDLEAVLDESSVVLRQLEGVNFWPMYRIGKYGYTQLASLLLCAGLPASFHDGDGDTMLHGAAVGGHLQLAKMLLDRGADVDARGVGETTPLMRAAKNGHLEVVKALVEAGANTTLTEFNDRTALYKARAYGRTDVVEYLEQLPH